MEDNQNLIKIFEYALNQEKTGMSFFETSLERLGVGAAVTAFKQIVEEEKRHIVFIEAILEKLRLDQDVDLPSLEKEVLEPTNYFDDRSRSEFLEKCLYESMIPDVTVFNTAWLIERDLSEFYEKMAGKVDGAASNALKMLAAWEKAHENSLRNSGTNSLIPMLKCPGGGNG